ncbi:hypothetical protein AAA799O18_00780 [Marine Group I thaumarchaeote SCGC AAA799-O18]|nr:hypothetical protein AAA799O18_00780 [Marine Group I thaumarchaeote SCGC AAA799-O18]
MALQYGAYIAMAGIGLYAIFVGEMISIFNYMLEPSGEALLDDFIKPPVDASGKILQFISIGVAPGLVMSATAYMIARKFGSKQIGWLIIIGSTTLFIEQKFIHDSGLVGHIEDVVVRKAYDRWNRKRSSRFYCYYNPAIIHGCFYTNDDCRRTFV